MKKSFTLSRLLSHSFLRLDVIYFMMGKDKVEILKLLFAKESSVWSIPLMNESFLFYSENLPNCFVNRELGGIEML